MRSQGNFLKNGVNSMFSRRPAFVEKRMKQPDFSGETMNNLSGIELKVKKSGVVTLPRIIDERDGALCIMNSECEIPFPIKRIYYINSLESHSSIRGKHAHRALRQVIFCINGCFTLTLDDGICQQELIMRCDNVGIILEPMLWHTMNDFSSGCVVLVVASDVYDEADYIRDYDEFLGLVKEGK